MLAQQQVALSVSLSTPQTVPAFFAEQAARTPAAPAVRHKETEWTYGELAARINRLTRFLVMRGIGSSSRVPVLAGPTPEALQAMLAVMQAGAAYVPLDPAYASQRSKMVLDETQSPLLLTTRGAVANLRPAFSGETVFLEEIDLSAFSAEPVQPTAKLSDVAYTIYTSGTTGKPNGVDALHDGLANYLSWCVKYYPMHDNLGGTVAFTSIGFDLTITSLFAPLLCGQPIRFIPSARGNFELLTEALRGSRERFSFVKMTPSHLRALRHLLSPEDLVRATGCLILGGEPLYAEDLASFKSYLGDTLRIFNEYGPTETVVGSICYEVTQLPESGPIPIGKPIDNTSVYVCDEDLKVLSAGSTGELCIGGRGVARGYHQREELTARKFVDFKGAPGERVYRTGDLGRLRPDGMFEFLGRVDHQVKVGGHRVELEEIEAALKEREAIEDAIVLLDGEREHARLVAFVLPNVSRREAQSSSGRMIRYSVTPSELHNYLVGRLPAHMIPSLFVFLDAIPMNAHGKVDRDHLRSLIAQGAHARAEYVVPRTELEEALSALFAKVLKIDSVGIDDNYFALGGDSIRSIQLAGELQQRGIKISVGDLHSFPTIRSLATHCSSASKVFVEMPHTKAFDLISQEDRSRIPAEVEDAYPLNLLQQGMIYHRAFAAKSAVYHAMLSLLLKAPFDLPALRHVVQELVNRHPLLRTSFDQRSFSIPLQLVHKTFKDPLQFADLSSLPETEQKARIATWIEDEKKSGFAVDEYPLIRFMVHQLGEDKFRLTFSYHHEILDGWSESTMVSELLTHYLSIVSGEPMQMEAPKASFRDSVLLEQMALQSEQFKTFWERNLEGASFMRLPRLLSSPKADKGQRAIIKLPYPFSKEASDGVKRLAMTLGVPLKSVLLAGHMKVMGLFGGSSDVLTHTVSTGRPESPDGIGLIGLFVNSFTFRQNLTHGSWRELILDTLKLEQASIPYRRYPMAELKRHQGWDPLSETLFFFIDYHVYHRLEKWKIAKLLDYQVYGESTFPFCATFRVNHFTSELDMQIEYDSLQFPRELVDAIAETYFKVYESMLANLAAKHHVFSPIVAQPGSQATAMQTAGPSCMHQWIEQQAAQHPDATALVCGRESISYASLNARANQLARWLIQQEVGPETKVGLLLERSVDLVIGMLAVLKTGACYIPLDPEHRSDRVLTIIEEAAPALVLTRNGLKDTFDKGAVPGGMEVRCLEDVWAEALTMETANLNLPVFPDQVAYVIFTSGSTGKPKGVMVQHSALVNSTAARLSQYDASPDRFLLLSSPAFDSSVAGIYWTLCTGGTLVLPLGNGPLDLNVVLNITRQEEITHTLCIPSFYDSMIESARAPDLAALQSIIVAGEECRTELWEQHKQKSPSVAFYNEYGPSEATVWGTVWKGDPSVPRASLSIGKPIDNVTAFIVDRDGQMVPTGVLGELCLGGANLARGYLQNPSVTAERFGPNPFATGEEGERLYQTGDLARLTLAGEIEFLGRIDHQIKVRGFRIEPAEIEAVLETHPKVKRATVAPRENQAREKVLVAYVVPAVLGDLNASELLAFSKDKLPKYLIPSSFVILEALPLTATGKVDRQALPSGDLIRDVEVEAVAPRTPTEEAIAGIWSRVLGVEKVGVLSDFFEMGGESLRAMRVLSQIRRSFDVELPIASLINAQATVAALAAEVDAALWLRANPAEGVVAVGFEDVDV